MGVAELPVTAEEVATCEYPLELALTASGAWLPLACRHMRVFGWTHRGDDPSTASPPVFPCTACDPDAYDTPRYFISSSGRVQGRAQRSLQDWVFILSRPAGQRRPAKTERHRKQHLKEIREVIELCMFMAVHTSNMPAQELIDGVDLLRRFFPEGKTAQDRANLANNVLARLDKRNISDQCCSELLEASGNPYLVMKDIVDARKYWTDQVSEKFGLQLDEKDAKISSISLQKILEYYEEQYHLAEIETCRWLEIVFLGDGRRVHRNLSTIQLAIRIVPYGHKLKGNIYPRPLILKACSLSPFCNAWKSTRN